MAHLPPAPCSLLPASCFLLPAPCSLLPAPCSIKNVNAQSRTFFAPLGAPLGAGLRAQVRRGWGHGGTVPSKQHLALHAEHGVLGALQRAQVLRRAEGQHHQALQPGGHGWVSRAKRSEAFFNARGIGGGPNGWVTEGVGAPPLSQERRRRRGRRLEKRRRRGRGRGSSSSSSSSFGHPTTDPPKPPCEIAVHGG